MSIMQSRAQQRQQAIIQVLRRIPPGCVASYGEIAARAGLPRCARLVGRVLREASEVGKLPWHRVLRADGRLAFAAGSREFQLQKRRLAKEGVMLTGVRVDLAQHGWHLDLDAELWAPPGHHRGHESR